jgi:pimeloyl-ACP methyl ester carboxylesterase
MRFTIKSSEKLPIRGNLEVPRGARALVILIHGFKGFKDWGFFPWLAEVLCDSGFAVCRFNMARSGIGGNPETFDRLDLFADDSYSGQLDDLHRVVDYCQKRVALPTFLAGHSRGGGVAILGAAGVHNLRGVITWSSIARVERWDEATVRQWRKDGYMDVLNSRTKQIMRTSTRILDDFESNRQRLDILAAVSRLEVPLLVIHGERDESVPVGESQEIAAAAPEVSRLVIGGASHTYNAIHPLVHVPRALMLAADVTARFVGAYS